MSWIDAQGREHQLLIAEHDAVVHDPEFGFDRQIVAGKPVPPELEDAYKQSSSKSSSSRSSASKKSESTDKSRQAEEDAARKSAAESSGKSGS